METREEAKDALRIIGFDEPSMRMVRKITRQRVMTDGVMDISRKWDWKYPKRVLFQTLGRALQELGPTYEAVRVAERAFHGAKNPEQVDRNLEWCIKDAHISPPHSRIGYPQVSNGGAYV